MPNIQDSRNERFSRFDSMSTEDLQAFLREDASKPMGEESGTEEIFYVMELLAKRRKAQNGGKSPAEALESFRQNYHTENETPYISESAPVAPKRSSSGRWRRGLAAAVAAIFILVIGNFITASALNFDLFAIIAKWTQETFHFGYAGQRDETNAPNAIDTKNYTGLQNALREFFITDSLAPTWLPEGYEEVVVRIEDTPMQRVFIAQYERGEDTIRIKIADYLDSYPEQIEQSSNLIEIYTHAGIDYYLFKNYDQLRAVWINQEFECYISGPLSISETKQIINSIKKG